MIGIQSMDLSPPPADKAILIVISSYSQLNKLLFFCKIGTGFFAGFAYAGWSDVHLLILGLMGVLYQLWEKNDCDIPVLKKMKNKQNNNKNLFILTIQFFCCLFICLEAHLCLMVYLATCFIPEHYIVNCQYQICQ